MHHLNLQQAVLFLQMEGPSSMLVAAEGWDGCCKTTMKSDTPIGSSFHNFSVT